MDTEQLTGLDDFWRVYETAGHAALLAESLPFGEGRAEQVAAEREALRRAVDGDWSGCEACARALGATYALQGVEPTVWMATVTALARRLTPLLVTEYGGDPARLAAALDAAQAWFDRRLGVITGEYLRARGAQGAESRFRGLLEAAPDAMVIVGSDGRIALVNSQVERVFGYTRDELLGQLIEVLVPERFRARHPEHRDGYFRNSHPRPMGAGLDLYARRRDGSEFAAEISLSPLRTPEGTLVTAAIRDITQRKVTETALKLANRELEAFSYSVAHDLRAPLRGMNGFAQLLLDRYRDKLDAEGQDWLQEILLNARRMGGLIDALLSLARLARSEMRPQRVDLSALARAVAAGLAARDPERDVSLVIADGLHADLDPRLALALLENLLGNAWKFTGHTAAARIEVGAVDADGAPAFFVRDNGAGFDMAFAEHLFGPFQRLHPAKEFPGTGIGLATVQRIVHRHGGRVWAEGRVGEGATFFFTLPSRSAEAAP
ncbi:MAG: PAS domain S-box protein [Deltaproteobacteria bacterium]|nr:PAS domain S-box protein [Myxococcales bacterium]MDP3220470.1 PAS domain S-box protein [Deltaproteobacteria bacterium]